MAHQDVTKALYVHKVLYVLKFNFAGSGDVLWRKSIHSKEVPVNQQGTLYEIVNENLGEYKVLDEEAMKMRYGRLLKPFIWVRETNKISKKGYEKRVVEYTLPGPLGHMLLHSTKGVFDWGKFSIKNTQETAIKVINEEITRLLNLDETQGVFVKLKGHSRGGVAANILASNLAKTYKENSKVKICAVSFDPVPGPSLFSDNVSEQYGTIDLGDMIDSAVVYSINAGYKSSASFAPQKILKTKVIVISTKPHDMGLYSIGEKTLKDGSTKIVKKCYRFKSKIYNPGKLYKLEKGVYWAEEKEGSNFFELTKIEKNNLNEYLTTIQEKGDSTRKNFLSTLLKERVENAT